MNKNLITTVSFLTLAVALPATAQDWGGSPSAEDLAPLYSGTTYPLCRPALPERAVLG